MFADAAFLAPDSASMGHRFILPGTSLASLICLWAVFRRRPGALPLLAGVATLFASVWSDADGSWGLMALIGSAVLGLAREIRSERREKEAATLLHAELEARLARLEATKARAEAELLKTSIQPHFLINTPTVLIEWVERDRPAASSSSMRLSTISI